MEKKVKMRPNYEPLTLNARPKRAKKAFADFIGKCEPVVAVERTQSNVSSKF